MSNYVFQPLQLTNIPDFILENLNPLNIIFISIYKLLTILSNLCASKWEQVAKIKCRYFDLLIFLKIKNFCHKNQGRYHSDWENNCKIKVDECQSYGNDVK